MGSWAWWAPGNYVVPGTDGFLSITGFLDIDGLRNWNVAISNARGQLGTATALLRQGWRPSTAAMVPWRWFCAHSVLEWCRGARSVRFWFRDGAVAYVLGTFGCQMGPWLGTFQRYDFQSCCGLRNWNDTSRNRPVAQRILTLRLVFCQLAQQALLQMSNRNVEVAFEITYPLF